MKAPAASVADLGILAFLDAPVWFLRQNFKVFVAIILPARLVAVIPSTAGQAMTWGASGDAGVARLLLGALLTYGGALFSMLVMMAAFGALAWAVEQRLEGRPAPAREAWRFGLRPPVFATAGIVGLVIVMGSALCLFPGLVATMYFALVLPVMAAEGLTGGKAMDRSIALARHGAGGHWFTTTGAWALAISVTYGLVSYAVGSLVTLPAGIMGAWLGVRAAAEGAPIEDITALLPGSLAVTINLTGAFLYVLADMYLVVACALLYRRARDLLEGDDLRRALDAP